MNKIDQKALQENYRVIAELVGQENMEKIYDEFRGTQINLSLRLYDRELVQQRILELYNGTNLKELADFYGYSQRWVREVVRDNHEKR